MDQIGRNRKANEQNRVKPRPKNGERPGNSFYGDQLQRTAGGKLRSRAYAQGRGRRLARGNFRAVALDPGG
jgi:hypothetical protein